MRKPIFFLSLCLIAISGSAMNILTPSGYKDILHCSVGDSVVAYDEFDGHIIYNQIEVIEPMHQDWFNAQGDSSNYQWFLINGTYKIFYYQNIWNTPTTIVHGFQLNVGDTIYDDNNNNIYITSITPTAPESVWYRLVISGDHSFIADGLTLHNASRFWVTGGVNNNWSTTGNWSTTSGGSGGSAVPLVTDDVTFDHSGNSNCTLDASARTCKTLTVETGGTPYTSTITFTNTLTVAGNVSLGASMGFSGASALIVNATGSLTSHGKTCGVPLTLAGTSQIYTLIGNWVNAGTVLLSGGGSITLNWTTSETLTANGSLTLATNTTVTGTAGIILGGTGTWSGAGILKNNLTINTAGTITLSGTVFYNTGTLTYTSGTVDASTNTSTLSILASTTLTTSGITWYNVTTTGNITMTNALAISNLLNIAGTTVFSGTGFLTTVGALTFTTGNVTIVNNLTVTGALFFSASHVITGAYNLYAGGNITLNNTNSVVTGTATLVVNGTGTISMPNLTTAISGIEISTVFNTAGTITMSGQVVFGGNGNTISYVSGTMHMSGSTFIISSLTGTPTIQIDCSGMTGSNSFNNVAVCSQGTTLTLLSNLYLTGTFFIGQTGVVETLSGAFSIYTPNLSSDQSYGLGVGAMSSGSVSGTATVVLSGTGSWSMNSVTTGYYSFPIIINTTGTTTIGNVNYRTRTITYIPNTGSTSISRTLTLGASTTLNTNVMLWSNISTTTASTITLSSDVNMSGTFSTVGATVLSGAFNLYCGGLTNPTSISPAASFAGITFNSTGTWSGAGILSTNLTIVSPAILTVSGTVKYQTGTFLYTSGTMDGASSPVISFTAATTAITCNSLMNFEGGLTFVTNQTINGSSGFTVNSLTDVTAGNVLTFKAGNTYTVNNSLTITGTAASPVQMVSATPSSYVNFILSNTGATQSVIYCNATDMDSHLGQTISDVGGTLTRTINWKLWTASKTIGSVN